MDNILNRSWSPEMWFWGSNGSGAMIANIALSPAVDCTPKLSQCFNSAMTFNTPLTPDVKLSQCFNCNVNSTESIGYEQTICG